MIPRRIHRIWLDDPLPTTFDDYGRAWDDLNPGWVRVDWRSSRALPAMPAHCDALVRDARTWCPADWKRWQADVLRLTLVASMGGAYVDTDVQPRAPLDPWLEPLDADEVCIVGRSPQHRRGVHPITNAVMLATPRHPYVEACVEQLATDSLAYRGRPLAQRIGPWMLTRVYERQAWPTVVVLDPDDLYGSRSPLVHMWNSARRRRGAPLG